MEGAGGSGIEMEERSPGARSRQLTLESQRQRQHLPWISSWLLLGRSGVGHRPFGLVDNVVRAGAKAYTSQAESFEEDFYHLCHRPKAHVQEIFDVFIRPRHIGTQSEETTRTFYYYFCLSLAID